MLFHYFVIISLWKRSGPLVWLKLALWFWRKVVFFSFRPCIIAIGNYLPLEKVGALHLNKHEFPHSMMHYANVGLNLPSGSDEEFFLFRQGIYPISILSPLRKKSGSSFEWTWIPFTPGCFMPSLIEIDPVVLEKKIF